jgi:hypothetical protein
VSDMLKKMQVSYHTLGRLLNLPVGVQIAAVREADSFKVAEFVLVDEYNKLTEEYTLDFETMQWVPSPTKGWEQLPLNLGKSG